MVWMNPVFDHLHETIYSKDSCFNWQNIWDFRYTIKQLTETLVLNLLKSPSPSPPPRFPLFSCQSNHWKVFVSRSNPLFLILDLQNGPTDCRMCKTLQKRQRLAALLFVLRLSYVIDSAYLPPPAPPQDIRHIPRPSAQLQSTVLAARCSKWVHCSAVPQRVILDSPSM